MLKRSSWFAKNSQRFARVSDRALSFELSAIKQIEIAASKDPQVISLAQGIPYLPTPEPIKDFVKEKIASHDCDRYSLAPGLLELREALSTSLEEDGDKYDPESEIIVTAGSIEGMTATLLSFLNRGDEVLVPSPTYTSYIGSIQLAGGVPRYFALDEDRGFDLSAQAFEDAITSRTRAVIFCTPNNPTGTIYSEEQTRRVLEIAVERDLLVIVDEAYKDYYFDNSKHFAPTQISWARNQIVRVCSFSKAYAMTGWRVGFIAAPAELANTILRVHDLLVTCAPVPSQYAALAALQFGGEALSEYVEIFKRHRDITVQLLDEMSEWLDYQIPQATYFAFPRLKDSIQHAHDSERFVTDLLDKGKVALVHGRAFGPTGESHVRINFGRSEEDLKQGLSRFADYLSNNLNSKRKDQARIVESPSESNTPSKKDTARIFKEKVLIWLARKALAGSNVKTIGIIGVRGKTVTKRIVTRALQMIGETSSSILSYNTVAGLCFSILGIPSPRTKTEKLLFPFRAIYKALLTKKRSRFLVLEYGMTDSGEIPDYLSIVSPQYLLVTGSIGYEEGRSQNMTELFADFIESAKPDLLITPEDEPWLKERLTPFAKETLVASENLSQTDRLSELSYPPLSSRSESYGYAFALLLGAHLGLSEVELESFLLAHTKS